MHAIIDAYIVVARSIAVGETLLSVCTKRRSVASASCAPSGHRASTGPRSKPKKAVAAPRAASTVLNGTCPGTDTFCGCAQSLLPARALPEVESRRGPWRPPAPPPPATAQGQTHMHVAARVQKSPRQRRSQVKGGGGRGGPPIRLHRLRRPERCVPWMTRVACPRVACPR